MDSRPFSEAPPAIIDALNRVTWAGRDAVKDGSFKAFNELLSLGYMEKQAIGVSPSNAYSYFMLLQQLMQFSGMMMARMILALMSFPSPWAVQQP